MQLTWPGFNEEGTVLVELSMDTFCLAKSCVVIAGELFQPKDELHITVIGTELGLMLQRKIKQGQVSDELLQQSFEAIDWAFKQTGPLHMLSRTRGSVNQKSIILLIEMPGIQTFYQQLKKLGMIDPATPLPPVHITLYTQNCANGIGVANEETLKTLSIKTLSLNTLKALCE